MTQPYIYSVTISLAFISMLFLSACGIDRDAADKKLASACKIGVELFLPEGTSVKEIRSTSFSEPDKRSDGDRRATLNVVESDGWYDAEKTYACNFTEDKGFLGMSYSASVMQIDMSDKIYGTKDGKIHGTYDEWLKITNAVDAALER